MLYELLQLLLVHLRSLNIQVNHKHFVLLAIRHKLTYEKSGREVSVHDETDVLPFAAYETTAYVVARISEIDVHIVAHLACNLKGMLDQELAELLPLIFGCDAKRPEGKWTAADCYP